MRRSRIRITGPLGTTVVLSFLLGFLSAPLRPCLSHQGHDHGIAHAGSAPRAQGTAAHGAHGAHDAGRQGHTQLASRAPAEGEAPRGCECLGLCQLETSPLLPLATTLAHVVAPAPDLASWRNTGAILVAGTAHAVPQARAPPPLV